MRLRSLMQAVQLDSDGTVQELQLRTTKSGSIQANRTRMHLLFHDTAHELAVLSKHDPRKLQCNGASIFNLDLPIPLNTYVYPNPVVICGLDKTGELVPCSTTDLHTRFEALRASHNDNDCDDAQCFYDMPLLQPFQHVEPLVEDAEELQESDDENFDTSEDEVVDDEDEEIWVDDDLLD